MPSASRTKAADRQNICRKLVPALKKHYGGKVPDPDLPVMESLLLAVCLEETPFDQGNASYARLLDSFHDLNEIRVSSLTELIRIFPEDPLAELRAMRIRNILQFVFEESFAFDLEDLQRKTLDQAGRQLSRIPELSPFVRLSVLQHPLGNHLIPVDEAARRALIWLGLADTDDSAEDAAGLLKSAIRKADGRLFCFLLHSLATDARYVDHFNDAVEQADSEGNGEAAHAVDLSTAASRLSDLLAGRSKLPKKKAPAKSATAGKKSSASGKKAPAAKRKKAAAPKAGKKSSTAASAGKKSSTPKAATGKKATGKKAAGKKATGKKAAGKKATARKKATGTSRTKSSTGRSRKSSTGSGRSRSRQCLVPVACVPGSRPSPAVGILPISETAVSDRHDQTVRNYARLAAVSWQRGQLPGRDRLLILCGAAACHAGLPAVAERCRELVLARNPRHLLHRYPSFPDALRGEELPPLVRQLTRQCSPEQAEFLLSRIDSRDCDSDMPVASGAGPVPSADEPSFVTDDETVSAFPAADRADTGSGSGILRWLAEPSVRPDPPAAGPGD